MAFNSDTYHANKAKREAYAWLNKARDIKRRAATGNAYDWEIDRIKTIVGYARSSMRISRLYRSMGTAKRERRNANPTYA